MPAITTHNLTRRFGNFTAVEQVNLDVNYGDVFGFLGPNGSGKTTVMKMLTGLLPLTSGEAMVDGLNVRTESEVVRTRIGYMSQKFSLYDDLSVAENLQFYARIYGLSGARMRQQIDRALEVNHLQRFTDRLAGRLSGGWKQRLALGCAMLHEPKILFLDEPTAGIDPVARRELWDLLFELSNSGITFFVTTHYMDEAERCNRLAYIYNSRLMVNGAPEELRSLPEVNPEGTRRVEIECSEPSRALQLMRAMQQVRNATIFGQSIHAQINADFTEPDLRDRFAHSGITLKDLRPLVASLEDVFVQLTFLRRAEMEAAHA
jgi:ABC-type multidrug transport system ATPase subunit